jgi:ABC transporter substrate binding protein (PQQ-dependent alcohol dehydrogenase system)
MIISAMRCALAFLVLLGALWPRPAEARATSSEFRVVLTYVFRDEDPSYKRQRAYTGLVLRQRYRPLDGARTAIREALVPGRASGVQFELRELRLEKDTDAERAIRGAMEKSGAAIFLLDLPLEDVASAAKGLAGENVILFNIRHGADVLRTEACSPVLFHTIASDAMLMDALAQFLRFKRWTDILVLEGTGPADRRVGLAFRNSARKYGLKISGARDFVPGNDPRHRDRNNIALLTAGSYDLVFLADREGEFGRYVPFQTQLPRPVVGSEGLRPSAWHWTWERYGAPQLNQRFDRRVKRRMSDTDWAAWAAVKSIVEAVVRTKESNPAKLRDFLVSDTFVLDTYKGTPASYRKWNHQLRQPVLLHTHNAVVARAPLEGFLHEHNTLDTLGQDERQSGCKLGR